MGKFAWEGTTKSGQVMKGEMEAPNVEAVEAQLRRQGISPGNIKERGKGHDMEIKIPGMAPKVSTKDLVVFTRQFATMIDAGLPLVQCLDILGKQQENKTFKKILLTGQAGLESAISAINKAELDRYIEKPWEIEDLSMTIRTLTEQFHLRRKIALYTE